jgi:hypothetical protein
MEAVDEHEGIPSFLLSANDPAAPFALLAYATAAHNRGASEDYVDSIRHLAAEMHQWQDTHGILGLGHSVMLAKDVEGTVFHT